MGCDQIEVYNRTFAKAEALASEFQVQAIATLVDATMYDVVLCTIPASAGFTLPKGTWRQERGEESKTKTSSASASTSTSFVGPKVVLDAAYRPRETALLRQARNESHGNCMCVEGIDMLIAQGYGQLRRWVNTKDLTSVVRDAIQVKVHKYYVR